MGVVTAVPLSEYEILSVDITKIGETKRMKRSPKQSTLERAVGAYVRMRIDTGLHMCHRCCVKSFTAIIY